MSCLAEILTNIDYPPQWTQKKETPLEVSFTIHSVNLIFSYQPQQRLIHLLCKHRYPVCLSIS